MDVERLIGGRGEINDGHEQFTGRRGEVISGRGDVTGGRGDEKGMIWLRLTGYSAQRSTRVYKTKVVYILNIMFNI